MWGNTKGWTIAVLWVALCCAWLYFLAHASAVTPPTAFSADAENFAPITLPTPPADLFVPASANIAAAALYRRAIAEYNDHPGLYENFAALGTLESPTAVKLEAIDLLVKASAARDIKLFTPAPDELLKFSHSKPPLDALRILSRVCIDRLALLNQRAGNAGDATKYYKAGFALGWNLSNERLTYEELQLGDEIVSESCAGLASLDEKSGQLDQAAAIRVFASKLAAEVERHVDPILPVVRNVDAKVVGARTGDVFELARRSHERMWRIEAIFAVGRIRYFAGDSGTAANQRVATQLLRRIAGDDPDGIVRRAATIALISPSRIIERYRGNNARGNQSNIHMRRLYFCCCIKSSTAGASASR